MIPPTDPVTAPMAMATHHHGRHKAGGYVNRILNPEDGHVQNQIPHRAPADAGDDGEPHEAHDVHPLARRDQCAGHGEYDGRKDVEELDEAEQVRGIDQCGFGSGLPQGHDWIDAQRAARGQPGGDERDDG